MLVKIISKLSPLVGNLIEFSAVEFLNTLSEFSGIGNWKRQDPGFPDAIFEGDIDPQPGFEIKAWFPLSTEITARFKDSQNHFKHNQTYVVMLAWLPEYVIFGKPKIVDVVTVSGISVAKARDEHYHNPPDYLVIEPEDTTERTVNLRQTNTNGYKFQGTATEFENAKDVVTSWGPAGGQYEPTREYQAKLRELQERFRYRLDTNYAKMDRIFHTEIEAFKSRVQDTHYHSMTIKEWATLLYRGTEREKEYALNRHLDIKRD